MAQEFWSDKPLKITISGKSPNNSGIPKIDITGEKGIICGRTITSTTNSLIRTVSNSAAGSSAKSVSTKFYASCQWDNPRRLTTDVNTYGNLPGCGKSTGNIKVKVWWDSVKKGDSSDDTYVEQTISNVTIKNAVETIDITGLSYSNGNPIPFKNGAYALNGYNELDGIYVNYRLKGEYHESNAATSTNLTYMPIYDSTVRVYINNTYSDSYTCVTPGTVEQYIINGKYFIPTKFNDSTSAVSTTGSTDGGVVGPGDTVATPFPSGTFQIILQALGGYRQPSTAVTLDVVVSSEPDYQGDYLTLSALEDGEITITISLDLGSDYATYLSYSKDKSVWERTDINGKNKTITIPVSRGDNVYLKGKAKQWYNPSDAGGASINSTANINVSGNIMSLLYEDNFEDKTVFPDNSQHTFSWLFGNNKHLCSAEKLILPATLTDYCYHFMFYGCSSLTQAPALPATTLTVYCYRQMFKSCTKLTQAPELPATTLANSCYDSMFSGCTSLTQAPALPATTLAQSCYESMFYGCSSLTQAPELPATTLTDYYYCYNYMFSGCNKLNYIKALFTTAPDESYTYNWLSGVSATGTFVKNSAATWTNADAGIPTGWTVETV